MNSGTRLPGGPLVFYKYAFQMVASTGPGNMKSGGKSPRKVGACPGPHSIPLPQVRKTRILLSPGCICVTPTPQEVTGKEQDVCVCVCDSKGKKEVSTP